MVMAASSGRSRACYLGPVWFVVSISNTSVKYMQKNFAERKVRYRCKINTFVFDYNDSKRSLTVYDWENVCKRKVIGSVTVAILAEDETGAVWYDLDSRSGQVGYAFMNNNQTSSSQCFITVATACTIPLTTQVSGGRSACVLAQRKWRRLLTGNIDLRSMNSIICEGRQTSFLFHQIIRAFPLPVTISFAV